jgi:hypothetical protein
MAIVACEAIIELWKKAGPLQGIRKWIINLTPFFYNHENEMHLLDCPYCISVWVGALIMAAYMFMDSTVFMLFVGSLSIHKVSNFLHIIFSFLKDKQLDLRVARNQRR